MRIRPWLGPRPAPPQDSAPVPTAPQAALGLASRSIGAPPIGQSERGEANTVSGRRPVTAIAGPFAAGSGRSRARRGAHSAPGTAVPGPVQAGTAPASGWQGPGCDRHGRAPSLKHKALPARGRQGPGCDHRWLIWAPRSGPGRPDAGRTRGLNVHRLAGHNLRTTYRAVLGAKGGACKQRGCRGGKEAVRRQGPHYRVHRELGRQRGEHDLGRGRRDAQGSPWRPCAVQGGSWRRPTAGRSRAPSRSAQSTSRAVLCAGRRRL